MIKLYLNISVVTININKIFKGNWEEAELYSYEINY